jgi:nitrite reductase (NADH) small subunit
MKEESLTTDGLQTGEAREWFTACRTRDIPENGGGCIQYKQEQIAIFYFAGRKEWFATQNLCPHKHQMILSRGILGETADEPKVACPFHKKAFSLRSGKCISDPELCALKTYPVKIKEGFVLIGIEK